MKKKTTCKTWQCIDLLINACWFRVQYWAWQRPEAKSLSSAIRGVGSDPRLEPVIWVLLFTRSHDQWPLLSTEY